MRYVAGILLLVASPALAADPVYSWRFRADDPEWAYLYEGGKQIGAWGYTARQYRSFDGTNWGPLMGAAPVRPPAQQVVVTPRQQPMTIAPASSTLPQLRGPLRVRLGTAGGQIVTDMTMRIFEEIPGAIVDSLKRGDYQLEYNYSVTRSPQEPEAPQQTAGQITPPIPVQPAQSPQRRWAIRRR